jgi:signal transduction histidine kinase
VVEMVRNKELLHFIAGASVVAVLAAVLCQFAGSPGIVCAGGCLCVGALFAVYTHQRYKNISRLNDYLRRLTRGEESLDIRDNAEGEMSILKNEIYKITAALKEQAETLTNDKRELVNALMDISHQLKTPLTAIGVMTDLLDNEDVPTEDRQEFLSNIRMSINRMEWLVLALLKLARLDAGAVELKREPVLLSALIERAMSSLLIPVEIREQAVNLSGEDASIICDLEWTSEALSNILKNAVENTPEGGQIVITYGNNPLYTFITVHDGGPGIDKADLSNLFKRFYRGKNAGKDSAGIGLSMSLAIMRKQNGDIEAANDNGGVFALKFYHTTQSDKTVKKKFTV